MKKGFKFDNSWMYDNKSNGLRVCWNWRTYRKGDKMVVFTVSYCDGHMNHYHVMGEHGNEYFGEDAVIANQTFALALWDIGVIK